MFCPKCGTQNPDDAQLCRSCSWALASAPAAAQSPDAKTSGLAITSLVLAILTPFTCLLTMIPAIICGILALVKIQKSAGQLKGKGFAVAGIAVPAVCLPVIVVLLTAALIPAMTVAKERAQQAVCASRLHQLSLVMRMYSDDNDGQYPAPAKWCDLLQPYYGPGTEIFICPSAEEGPCNYAINPNAAPTSPPDTVLLFETYPGWNQAGGPEILNRDSHHGKGCNIVFNDLHVEFIKAEDLNDLKW